MGHRLHLQQPALMTRMAVVTGKFGHGIAGMAVLILDYMVAAGQDPALDHIFCVDTGLLIDRETSFAQCLKADY